MVAAGAISENRPDYLGAVCPSGTGHTLLGLPPRAQPAPQEWHAATSPAAPTSRLLHGAWSPSEFERRRQQWSAAAVIPGGGQDREREEFITVNLVVKAQPAGVPAAGLVDAVGLTEVYRGHRHQLRLTTNFAFPTG